MAKGIRGMEWIKKSGEIKTRGNDVDSDMLNALSSELMEYLLGDSGSVVFKGRHEICISISIDVTDLNDI